MAPRASKRTLADSAVTDVLRIWPDDSLLTNSSGFSLANELRLHGVTLRAQRYGSRVPSGGSDRIQTSFRETVFYGWFSLGSRCL